MVAALTTAIRRPPAAAADDAGDFRGSGALFRLARRPRSPYFRTTSAAVEAETGSTFHDQAQAGSGGGWCCGDIGGERSAAAGDRGGGARQLCVSCRRRTLANPDPIWTTATVAINHGYMVYDTLYGIDNALVAKPQMCAGHELSSDELTWTFTLRDGLQSGTTESRCAPIDCTTSIHRWAAKNPFGQQLASLTEEMKPLDDKRFQIRLKKRFRQMLYALGAQHASSCRSAMAKTPASEQIKEYIGSGPFVFLREEWVSGAKAAYVKNSTNTCRARRSREYLSGGKVVHFERVEWIVQPDPATAAAALQTGEVDWLEFPLIDLLPMLRKAPGCDGRDATIRSAALAIIAFNHLYPPFDNPKLLRALLPAIDQREYVTAWVGEQAGSRQVSGRASSPRDSPMANKAGMEAFTTPRDLARAKKLVAESGYKGEKIVLMAPSDQPSLVRDVAGDARAVHEAGAQRRLPGDGLGHAGLAARARWTRRHRAGGTCSTPPGAGWRRPIPAVRIRCAATARQGWFGWPTDAKMEELRAAMVRRRRSRGAEEDLRADPAAGVQE